MKLDTYQWKSDFALDQLDLWVQRAATIDTAEQLFD
ncbi:MAG: hypothetical protein JWN52_7036 [Actinomycetia bacterium]|nr:hypothetical protein [Actinomycetes bacterium]